MQNLHCAGRIVGGYFLNNHTHGFQLYKGQLTTIDCAGSTGSPGFQFLSGLDPIGRMVGGYETSDGLTHGSLIIEGNCITIDIPPVRIPMRTQLTPSETSSGATQAATARFMDFFFASS